MIFFTNDYGNGAHPEVLRRLVETNAEKTDVYGFDLYSDRAADKIRQACGCPGAAIKFLVGGTQTNATALAILLSPYEAVFAAVTGHINGHEAAAVECTGHKVLPLPEHDGKVAAADVETYCRELAENEAREHCAQPGAVYISHPTEYGTLYSKVELQALSAVCRQNGLRLFLDGARLGYALACPASDVTLPDIAACCDAFYIGGTKVGALCGEALVFTRNEPPHFLTQIKQHGALLAKGRLIGVQFDALFTDNLYEKIGEHAIAMATKLKAVFEKHGIPFFRQSDTNQQFVVLTKESAARLAEQVGFEIWEPIDDTRVAARFVTSWSTDEADIEALDRLL